MSDRSKSVKPNGEEVRRLRKSKGWSVQDLAVEAELGDATVSSVEYGKPCHARTLRAIAMALEVKVSDISASESPRPDMKPTAPPVPVAASAGHLFRIRLKSSFRATDDTQDVAFIERLLLAAEPYAEIEYVGPAPGSAIYAFSIVGGDRDKLLRRFHHGHFDSVGANAVQLLDPTDAGAAAGGAWVERQRPQVKDMFDRAAARDDLDQDHVPAAFDSDPYFAELFRRERQALGPFARGLTRGERSKASVRLSMSRRRDYQRARELFTALRDWLGTATIPHTLEDSRAAVAIVHGFTKHVLHPETGIPCVLAARRGEDGGELYLQDDEGNVSQVTTCITTMLPFCLFPPDDASDADVDEIAEILSAPDAVDPFDIFAGVG